MAQLLSDEILEMTLQSLHIEDKRSIRLVCKRFKRIVDWSIKICIVLGKTNSTPHSSFSSSSGSSSGSSSSANTNTISSGRRGKDAELYYPSKYQYVTCISVAGECKELQNLGSCSVESPTQSVPSNPQSKSKSEDSGSDSDLISDVYQFPIKFEPLALFSHCKLRRLVIGQGVSGLSPSFISRILRYSCSNLEKLGWHIDVSEIREETPSKAKENDAEIGTPNTFLKGLDFKNLTELSLKLVQKPGRGENTRAFLSLLQNHFPKLYSFSLVLISEPIAIFTVRNSVGVNKESFPKVFSENSPTNCEFQYDNSWPIYFETFYFISKHSRNLRVLELDYSHLNLEIPASELNSDSDLKDHPNWKNFERIKKSFLDLELHTLDLVCPKMEGISPWTLCSSLFSSQRHLTDLMLKTRGNPHLLSVNSTFRQNKSLENLYFSNPDNWNPISNTNPTSNPNPHSPFLFDFASIENCDKLKSLEVNYCSGFLNVQEIPISLRKLKLRSLFTSEDLSRLLQNCQYLRKLHLHNDGNFWRGVSLDTVKIILEHGSYLRKVFMDHFDITSVQEYCQGREDLRLAVLKRNKGRLKIRRGNFCEKKISTSSNTNTNTVTTSRLGSSSSQQGTGDGNGNGENSENEKATVQSREEQEEQEGGTCSNSNSNSNFNSMSVSTANSLASDENCLQDPR